MRIKIYGSPRDLSMTDTEVIERQVQFALSRFDGLVQKGVVTVKQSIDSHDCRIQLRLRSGVSITSRECRTDLATATSAAARGGDRSVGTPHRIASAHTAGSHFYPDEVWRLKETKWIRKA